MGTKTLYILFSYGNLMVGGSLSGFFEDFLTKESLFLNRKILTTSHKPVEILHREIEIEKIAGILAPSLKVEKPSNLLIYGNTGTGKTLTVKHVTSYLVNTASKKDIPLTSLFVNCKIKRVADTEYRLISQLSRLLGKQTPPTGMPTDEIYKTFYSAIEERGGVIIVILDEIDQLISRAGDNVLYNLTRVNEDLNKSQICLVGISNDTCLMDNVDVRVKSSLCEEDVLFAPYNAMQLQDILKERAKAGFKEGAIGPGVIEKCSAYIAREHGDARKAIELLRVSGELAERAKQKQIVVENLDDAEKKLERDKVLDIVKSQPRQFQTVLLSILYSWKDSSQLFTGEVYSLYRKLCFKIGLRPLTQRRVSDIIGEYESMGIISTRTLSKGRYGRTREVNISIPTSTIPLTKKILEEEAGLVPED
jgi:archaeal cell division control protein 6